MRDWRVGMIERPCVSLATAVAASSAFPPVLSPLVMKLNLAGFGGRSRKRTIRARHEINARFGGRASGEMV